MASNIVLKTFAAGDDGQGTVTPQDDALIYQNAVPMNGIFSGATVTLSEANVLHIAAGFGIIGGRFFEINESDITVELSSSGTLLGRLYIHLELTNADVPISINVATGASLPALVGDPDLNINDGAFDLELATFNVSEVTISDLVNTFPTISKANNQLRRATAYSVNDMVLCQSASDSLIFICTTAGTTAVQQPTGYATITDDNTIADGTAVFKAYSIAGSINKANDAYTTANIVQAQVSNSNDAYDPTRPYKVGELCIYNNVLYRCITACSAGSWATNQSCFTQDTLVNMANDTALKLISDDISNSLSTSGSYIKLYANKNKVILSVSITLENAVNANVTTLIGRIPSSYRPTVYKNVLVSIAYGGARYAAPFEIDSSTGDMNVLNTSGGTSKLYISCDIEYIR